MSRTFAIMLCLVCLPGCIVPYTTNSDSAPPQTEEVLDLLNFVEADGLNFPYRLFVPPGYDRHEEELWPLAICLHARGATRTRTSITRAAATTSARMPRNADT